MPRKVENIIGQKFGRLLVVKNLGVNSHGSTLHRCICDCGNIKDTPISYLKQGHTTSCGCLVKQMRTVHTLSQSRLYNIHQGMLKRCYNENSAAYQCYGGRGIIVCNEWKNDFVEFYKWAMENGYEDNLTIERIDNDGNYEPNNCRWATKAEQTRNTRKNVYFTFNGVTKTMSEWAKTFDIPLTTFRRRMLQNRPFDEIISKNRLKNCKKEKANGYYLRRY